MRKLLLVVVLFPLAAHAQAPQPARPISWFKVHLADLAVTLSVCRDNSQYANTPTCVNAQAAATGLRGDRSINLNALLSDPRYWSANPLAREGLLAQCQLGTAMEPRLCKYAAQSALSSMQSK